MACKVRRLRHELPEARHSPRLGRRYSTTSDLIPSHAASGGDRSAARTRPGMREPFAGRAELATHRARSSSHRPPWPTALHCSLMAPIPLSRMRREQPG